MPHCILIREISEILEFSKNFPSPRSLCLGNFDGLHLGHQALIAASKKWSQACGGHSWVLSFDPHPMSFFNRDNFSHRLFDIQDQLELLAALGVQGLILQKFDKEFSEMSPEIFFKEYLLKTLQVSHLVVGHDFRFGKKRQGTVLDLKKFCEEAGIEIYIQQAVEEDGERVSSSLIKKHLAAGQMLRVQKLLGRFYFYRGLVVKGEARGRQLGFPTANVLGTIDFTPRVGVYASRITLEGESESLPSITNVGVKPTFPSTALFGEEHRIPKYETHILDFDRDIYGTQVKIELVEFLRDEIKFESSAHLVQQIIKDILFARSLFCDENEKNSNRGTF